MRKYLKIVIGLFRLLCEEVLNGFRIKVHGIYYCVSSGVKFWIYKGSECDIGKKTWFSENCIIECNGGDIKIGNNNFFNTNCRITSMEKIVIGDNNLFGPNIIIVDHNHKYEISDQLICKQGFTKKEVIIGSNIWIGGNVTICQGVVIGDNVVIGANAVVNHNCVESGVYVGAPAQKIKDIEL